MIELSYKQRLWLHSRGGRNDLDVEIVNDCLYVTMINGRQGFVFVQIPEDDYIDLYRNKKGLVQSTSKH